MKYVVIFIAMFALFACNDRADKERFMQDQIDSLQNKLSDAYRPGLGEFMSSIQVHHTKLWFAGQYQNWRLADFEMNEIKESLDDIKKYCADRPEVSSIGMIAPAMDSMSNAIQQKNMLHFKSSYLLLTNTCNNCHHATDHEFNVIKVPDAPPFSDQDLRSIDQK